MKADNCIFCKIANGEIPAKTLYEDDRFRVILDLGPATRGHALILPKDHYADLFELPEESAGEVMKLAKKMVTKMRGKLGCEGFNLVQNNGDLAGQTVFHFHLHLIPRYSADGQKIGWKQRPRSWMKSGIRSSDNGDCAFGNGGSMKTIETGELTRNIREMCIEANHFLSADMDTAMKRAAQAEESALGKQILGQLKDNLEIAGRDMIPICQDTGMAVIFLEIGQDVHFEGENLTDAVNEGVRQGYTNGYLRKSVVGDPLIRENTKDNTPAVIHYEIVPGDQVKITVAPKGFGSENMSRVFMLKPADGIEGVKDAILTTVRDAGPNACPPMVVGVGIGGNFEKCALMAKHALTRSLEVRSEIPYIRELEEEMLALINKTGIGPGGLGGTTTALAVNIETYPTHIAGLPVAVNICCHVNRHAVRVL